MTGKQVTAIVCANGLGHFRRTLEVLHALSRLEPGLRLDVVCGQWQRERMRDWDVVADLEGHRLVRWIHGVMEPGVHWSLDPAVYADGRLLAWTRRLAESRCLETADLVLSDNLTGVLETRPDAVLMGSFLWSDVLEEAYPADPDVAGFAARERKLLADHRPHMLCVEAIAMPAVAERTRAVPLPWMRSGEGRPDIRRRPARPKPKVAVLIGATGAADPMAAEAAAALLEKGAEVALPKGIYEPLQDRPGASRFGFEAADFLGCDVALCRPGLGSIHDCIYYGLPMVLAQEIGNAELRHNGARIEALGLGIDLGHLHAAGGIADRLLEFAASGTPDLIRDRMAGTPLDGIGRAAQWLRARLGRP